MMDWKKSGFVATACMALLAAALLFVLTPAAAQSAATAQPGTRTAGNAPADAISGYVKSLTPPAFIRKGNGQEVPAKDGDLIGAGDTVRTGAGGAIGLLFADGQNISLDENSTMRIDAYRFDVANSKTGRASFVLVSGTMRVVTGAIHTGNAAALRIAAGPASINILSKDVTAFVMELQPGEQGRASIAVTVGEISVLTPAGESPRIGADQFSRWQDGVAPAPPQPLAAAPAVFQALAAASRATVQESNLPLDVRTAATQPAQGAPADAKANPLGGQLNMVIGTVLIRDTSGGERPAKVGDAFGPGSVVVTFGDGQAGLLFSEGYYAALGKNSTVRVASAGVDPRGALAGDAALGLSEGRMSFVTWAYVNGDATPLNIAVGNAYLTIVSKGVTAFVVEVADDTKDAGAAAVSAGKITVRMPDGPTVAVTSDKFTSWRPDNLPKEAVALTNAPASMQAAFADTIANAPENAEVAAEVASLPPTSAGSTPPAPAPVAIAAVIVPPVSPGGGGGCTGSPC